MRELIVRQLRQRALTFERRDLWQTFPDLVQRPLRRAGGTHAASVLDAETVRRSDDDREDSRRSS
jgi:hypothetical protein